MKSLIVTLAFLSSAIVSLAQTGTYIKYSLDIKSKDDQMAMMESMMMGSTMEIATSAKRTYAKNNMGVFNTTEIEVDNDTKIMTMYMTGMMGNMAFSGNVDSVSNDDSDTVTVNFELVDETKDILGYRCKKATSVDAEGNKSVYWYTEDIARPDGVSQMPNQIPGLCLEMNISNEMMDMTYTASEVKENTSIDKYKVVVPESVDIQSFDDLQNMGGGF